VETEKVDWLDITIDRWWNRLKYPPRILLKDTVLTGNCKFSWLPLYDFLYFFVFSVWNPVAALNWQFVSWHPKLCVFIYSVKRASGNIWCIDRETESRFGGHYGRFRIVRKIAKEFIELNDNSLWLLRFLQLTFSFRYCVSWGPSSLRVSFIDRIWPSPTVSKVISRFRNHQVPRGRPRGSPFAHTWVTRISIEFVHHRAFIIASKLGTNRHSLYFATTWPRRHIWISSRATRELILEQAPNCLAVGRNPMSRRQRYMKREELFDELVIKIHPFILTSFRHHCLSLEERPSSSIQSAIAASSFNLAV
jgi:hypothetical protein